MCGRFSQPQSLKDLASRFSALPSGAALVPAAMLLPSQRAAVVIRESSRVLTSMRWGLAPSWANEDPGAKHFNARAETLAEKASFREAFKARRCLVPADAFFERRKGAPARSATRVVLKEGGVFSLAGLWESWRRPDGAELRSFTVVTTSANTLLLPIHERMPVILDREDEGRWLDPGQAPAALQRLLAPFPGERLELCDTGQLALLA